jgi:transcriptional regulator with XRE-family HTH domain
VNRACLYQLDVISLVEAIDEARQEQGMSWRALARELGLSPSLFTRMFTGGRPDADSLVTMLMWLGTDLDNVVAERAA